MRVVCILMFHGNLIVAWDLKFLNVKMLIVESLLQFANSRIKFNGRGERNGNGETRRKRERTEGLLFFLIF